MAEPTPADQVELMTRIWSGVDHLIELLKPRPYDDVRVMAADLIAAFAVLEQDKADVPDTVLESQSKMLEALLGIARSRMDRAWHHLDIMVFGLEAAETVIRIHNQATATEFTRSQVALSILALMFLKPEEYIATLEVRNAD